MAEKLFAKGWPKLEGFPVVTSREEMKIVGYVSKRDLKEKMGSFLVLHCVLMDDSDNYAKRNKSISTQTACFFFDRSQEGPDKEPGLDFFDIMYNVSFKPLCSSSI